MRAVVCRRLGAPPEVETVDDPTPGPGQVLVDVDAAGVTYVDALLVGGRYQFPVPTPFVPGGEVAGRVVAVGDGVSGHRIGDAVVASTTVGGFAERCVLAAGQARPLPAGLQPAVAATALQAYSTAVYALAHRDPVAAGEQVLVLGAGGGVGLAMIDVAVARGARVIAAASSAEKRAAALAMGAAVAVDTLADDLKTTVRELSGGGVDVVVDPVGGDLAEPALRTLGFGGRYLVVGFAGGPIPRIPLNLVLLNSRTVVGVEYGGALPKTPGLAAAVTGEVFDGLTAGRFHPVRPTVRPLGDAAAVLDELLDRRVVGKIALDPGK
ncbi:MAG TPA: zinc-binding dehydrogenase [Acidimicrobiales bacterium]|nr:zinc-binding dehydrogenase [Acidimicrobiales bacterium]